jgi:hypothetical protein
MSRPQKIHPPLKGGFANILMAVADGSGVSKKPTSKRPLKSHRGKGKK